MKNPFKKAVHWGPNIVNVFEPTVFKSSAESHKDGGYLQNSSFHNMRSLPRSSCCQCKMKSSPKTDRGQGHEKNSLRARRSATKHNSRIIVDVCPSAARDASGKKKQTQIPKASTRTARKCKCCKKAHHREGKVPQVRRKHHSSATHGNRCTSKSHKCDKYNTKDKYAKVCKKQPVQKQRKILKCSSTTKILEKETRECIHVVKIRGGEGVFCPTSNHVLDVEIWLTPHFCDLCRGC